MKTGPTTIEGMSRLIESKKAEWAKPNSVYRTPEYRRKQVLSHKGKVLCSNQRHLLSAECLTQLYLNEKFTQREIAVKLNVSPKTVSRRMAELGIAARSSKVSGEGNPAWKGGRIEKEGYIMIRMPNHPHAKANGYVYEHILVWEQAHGQPLPEGWEIHHDNEVKSDNSSQNLIAFANHRKHLKIHMAKYKLNKEK